MGYLDSLGLAHLWGKVKAKLGLKMDKSVYDPQGKAEDVFAYVNEHGGRDAVVFTVTYNKTTYAEAKAALLSEKILIFRYGRTLGHCVYGSELESDTNEFIFIVRHNVGGGDYYTLKTNNKYAYYRYWWVSKSGDTMDGPLTLSGPPVETLHAATKGYVDGLVGEINTLLDHINGEVV